MGRKVVFATPTIKKPFQCYLDAMEKTVPFLEKHGWDCQSVYEIGSAYISHARSKALRKALDIHPEYVVFIDHDLSWEPEDMLALLEVPHHPLEVIAGTYRFKDDTKDFMGQPYLGENGIPLCRNEGDSLQVMMDCVPAGFLRISPHNINVFMVGYPELIYGERYHPMIDLFNHGARDGCWYGEDYAFCRRWKEADGRIWCLPKLNLIHHAKDADGNEIPYGGTYDEYLRSLKDKPDGDS